MTTLRKVRPSRCSRQRPPAASAPGRRSTEGGAAISRPVRRRRRSVGFRGVHGHHRNRRGSRRSTVSATRRGERKPGELGRRTTQPARGSPRNIGDATGSPTSCLDRNRDDARLTWPRWSSTLGAAAACSSMPVVTTARRSTWAIPSEASGQGRNHKTLDVAVAGQGSGWGERSRFARAAISGATPEAFRARP